MIHGPCLAYLENYTGPIITSDHPPVMLNCHPASRANKLKSTSSPGRWNWNGQMIMMQVVINYLNILGVLVDPWTMSDRYGELYGA